MRTARFGGTTALRRAGDQVALDFGQAAQHGDHQVARAGAGIGAREGNPSVERIA